MSQFKLLDSTKNIQSSVRWEISFSKDIVENADLHKPILNKIKTTQE